MMLAASKALSGCVTAEELRDESVLPRIERLRWTFTVAPVKWLPACCTPDTGSCTSIAYAMQGQSPLSSCCICGQTTRGSEVLSNCSACTGRLR